MSQQDPNSPPPEQSPPEAGRQPWGPASPQNQGGQPGQPWGAPAQRGNPEWGNTEPGNPQHGNQQPWGAPPQWGNPQWANPQPGNPQYGNQQPWGAPGNLPSGYPAYAAPPKPGVVPLRPLMFGEIMDGSFQTIRRNPKAMLGAGLLAQALGAIAAGVLTAAGATSEASMGAWLETQSSSELAGIGLAVAGAIAVISVVTLFISAVLQGAMVVPVARSILNRRTGFRQMWMLARGRAWALVRIAGIAAAAGLLATAVFAAVTFLLVSTAGPLSFAIVFPLGLAFLAAFVWIAVKLTVAPAAIVIEELGALDGIRRSWSITRGNWWRIFGIILVVSLLVSVIVQIVLIPVSLVSGLFTGVVAPHDAAGQAATIGVAVAVATAVVSALAGAVGFAFQTSVMALLYMDLRMRKDGLDIALLRLLETGADDGGIPGRGVPVYRTGSTGPATGWRPPSGGPTTRG
ncbi:proline-rich domain-containing protein [Arthrobacter sp. ZGTC131]|uniref:proline-rich domain-containing protein n=1 Tax=Arthrobacter sp. ZGTC131 TaxID=2058898 RepID=UPI0011B0F413|nr:proline-rich domain-containing protein [Arthrobacter sp. ZGTC131]